MANTDNLDLKRLDGPKTTKFDYDIYVENNFEKVDAAVGAKPADLTTTAKTIIPSINELKSDKVDKVAGKGLSTNDFDNTYKQKIDTDIPAQLADIDNKLTIGKNLFNRDNVINGFYVNQSNGTLAVNASYSCSDFINIVSNQQYCFTVDGNVRVAFYDENKNYISGIYPVASPFTTPVNAKYIRFSMATNLLYLQQLEKGSQATAYEPYGYKFSKPLPTQKDLACEIVLPPKIYALKGKELNIYFDNILNDKDTKYDFDVTCTIGNQLDNCFRVTPASAGIYPITIKAYQDNIERAVATSSIIVTDTLVGNGVTKKLIVIGDSTTDSNWASIKINENFSTDVMNIATIGTRGSLTNKHEGRSGWKANFYVSMASFSSVTNAFWNPATSKFDFGYYMLNSGVDVPDYVVINLGINDMFSFLDDVSANAAITTVLSEYQTMIDSIRAYSAAIKIGIAITIPPSYEQSAFGKNYGNGTTRWRYKRNNFLWIKALINNFKAEEAQGIYLVPINVNIDTRYNYGLESLPVNARNSKTVESIVANGGVHPDVPGYWQIADSFWYWLKSFEV